MQKKWIPSELFWEVSRFATFPKQGGKNRSFPIKNTAGTPGAQAPLELQAAGGGLLQEPRRPMRTIAGGGHHSPQEGGKSGLRTEPKKKLPKNSDGIQLNFSQLHEGGTQSNPPTIGPVSSLSAARWTAGWHSPPPPSCLPRRVETIKIRDRWGGNTTMANKLNYRKRKQKRQPVCHSDWHQFGRYPTVSATYQGFLRVWVGVWGLGEV